MRIDKKEPEEENADHGGVRTVTALHKVADYRMIALRTEPPTAPTDYLSRPATPVTN